MDDGMMHNAAPVPDHRAPFFGNEEHVLWATIKKMEDDGISPFGFGVLPDEWEHGVYQEIYPLRVGSKVEQIRLPNDVWLPRAKKWACALYAMEEVLKRLGR